MNRHLLMLVLVLVLATRNMPRGRYSTSPAVSVRLVQAMDLTVTVTTTLVEISDMASQTTVPLGAHMAGLSSDPRVPSVWQVRWFPTYQFQSRYCDQIGQYVGATRLIKTVGTALLA